MKKSKRISKIVDIASQKEQLAIREVGLKQRKSQVEQKKLKDLFQYLEEYIGQYSIIVSKSLSGKQFVQYQVFLEKLNEAINQQEQVVEHASHDLIQSKTEWANARVKKESYKKLMDKTAAQELREQAKREQLEIDDRCKRKDWYL